MHVHMHGCMHTTNIHPDVLAQKFQERCVANITLGFRVNDERLGGGGVVNELPKSGSLTHNRVRSSNTYKYIHPDVASITFTLQMMALNTVMFGLIFFHSHSLLLVRKFNFNLLNNYT